MFAGFRSKFEDSLFEFRHHAYVEMAWYFGMCMVMNLAFGVWGAVSVNLAATNALDNASQRQTCALINDFLIVFAVLCFADAFLNLCLVLALPSIMRGPKWAGCGLLSLSLFGILLIGKVITVILGAVWILGRDGMACSSYTSTKGFYTKSKSYFIAVTIVLSLQITVGTLYLLKCGLQDAVEEGVDQLEQEALIRQAREDAKAGRHRGD